MFLDPIWTDLFMLRKLASLGKSFIAPFIKTYEGSLPRMHHQVFLHVLTNSEGFLTIGTLKVFLLEVYGYLVAAETPLTRVYFMTIVMLAFVDGWISKLVWAI